MSMQDTSETMMKAVFPAFDGFALTIAAADTSSEGLNAKRVLDIAASALLIILFSPLLALVSLAVMLDSRGPLMFAQRRTGLNGKTFPILKFRSMHVMEDGAEVKQAAKGDARITRVGRVIRKLSLDELPQLFNVLAGDMSLVGPRPHAVAHDEYYGAELPNYAVRQQVKPGITGWAQVNGARGETPTLAHMQARVDLDAWYVENTSLALDLLILARTPLEVLRTRNAV
jgi:putative colanic acid biosynthesis UDP-glucose lipid carrier transferase